MGSPRISGFWAIPSTDNPLIPFGLLRATPRQTGPCCPFGAARATPVLWGFPVSMLSTVHASPDGLFPGLPSGRSRRQDTDGSYPCKTSSSSPATLAKTRSPHHPGRHQHHQLQPRHLASPPLGRSRPARRERLPGHGHRMAPHHLLQRSWQDGRGALRKGHEGPRPRPHPLQQVDRQHGQRPLRLRDHRREGRLASSRPKSAETENPELVDRDDEIPF